jgi:hypothetical protein
VCDQSSQRMYTDKLVHDIDSRLFKLLGEIHALSFARYPA